MGCVGGVSVSGVRRPGSFSGTRSEYRELPLRGSPAQPRASMVEAALAPQHTRGITVATPASVRKQMTPPSIRARKGGDPIVCLTSYTASLTRLIDPHVDLILVGDSLAMTIYGMTSTVGVTVDMMIAHGRAVARTASQACVVVDLPFGSYEESPAQAFRTASRVMADAGCAAVKLEGGAEMAETIRFLTQRGVPVMAHIGLTPQSVNALGGYPVRGRGEGEAAAILADAQAVAGAGAFSVVIEKTAQPLSREITAKLDIPTIGIGAS